MNHPQWPKILTSLVLSAQLEAATPLRYPQGDLELYSPTDPYGFHLKSRPEAKAELPSVSPQDEAHMESAQNEDQTDALETTSLNGQGFLNTDAHTAIQLTKNPIVAPSKSRIYSGGVGYVTLGIPHNFSALLHAGSEVQVIRTKQGWEWNLLRPEAQIRLSCFGSSPTISWTDSPESSWQQILIRSTPDADLILHQQNETLEIWQLRGKTKVMLPSETLQRQRTRGYLYNLETIQIKTMDSQKTQIEIYPGQVLRLEKNSTFFSLVLTIANPLEWNTRVAESSPLFASMAPNPSLYPNLKTWRESILKQWLDQTDPSLDAVHKLLEQGRYEEAWYQLEKVPEKIRERSPNSDRGLESYILFQLQQIESARSEQLGLRRRSPWRNILDLEYLKSQLRMGSKIKEIVFPPADENHRYVSAIAWQTQAEYRKAMDQWSTFIPDTNNIPLELSKKEWIDDLWKKKPWSLFFQTHLIHSDNIFLLPHKKDPDKFPHRSSGILGLNIKTAYAIEHTQWLSLAWELDINQEIYRYSELQDIALSSFQSSWPLAISTDVSHLSQVFFRPRIGRMQRGNGSTLDVYAYDLGVEGSLDGTTQWALKWQQDIFLDPQPGIDPILDFTFNEPSIASDLSLKRHSLSLELTQKLSNSWHNQMLLTYEQNRFSSPLKKSWNRQRLSLQTKTTRKWSHKWNSEAGIEMNDHIFMTGNSSYGFRAHLGTAYEWSLRWRQGLEYSFERGISVSYGTFYRQMITSPVSYLW